MKPDDEYEPDPVVLQLKRIEMNTRSLFWAVIFLGVAILWMLDK